MYIHRERDIECLCVRDIYREIIYIERERGEMLCRESVRCICVYYIYGESYIHIRRDIYT